MKKILFTAIVLAAGASFTSCKKCASCSVGDTTEYCRGSILENAVYDAAKSSCNASGGSWG
jgi:hypothetical protein